MKQAAAYFVVALLRGALISDIAFALEEKSPKENTQDPGSPACLRLKPGQSAIVKYTRETSPTGAPAAYGLSRIKDDLFLVELREKFVKAPDYEGSLKDKDLNAGFQKLVSDCIQEFNGILKNERSGRKLVLRLSDNAALPIHTIRVGKPGYRERSGEEIPDYPGDIPCDLVLHEQLRLLGLPEDLSANPGADEAQNSCIASAPSDSVMTSPWKPESYRSRSAFQAEMCRCEKKGFSCFELSATADGKKCPPGSSSFFKPIDPDYKKSLNAMNNEEAFALNEKQLPLPASSLPHDRSLYPAHFRAITEPGCDDVNGSYYSCVAFNNRFSKVDPAKATCPEKGEGCKWGSHKWLE